MILPSRITVIFKVISCLMAGIFLFQQVAWAGDLVETVLHQQADAQAQTFAPSYLQSQQTLQESIINQKQDAENFAATVSSANLSESPSAEPDTSVTLQGKCSSGSVKTARAAANAAAGSSDQAQDGAYSTYCPTLNVTTSAGDVINYKEGAIDSIRKADGTIMRNIVVDGKNNLINAEITYIDGTLQVIKDGMVETVTRPDGTIYNYDSEAFIESVIYPDGKSAVYSYIKDGGGNILEAIVTDDEKVSYYDSDDRLEKVVFNNGRLLEYDSGIISRITESDLTQYLFDITENPDGTFTAAYNGPASDAVPYARIEYDECRVVKKAVKSDGTELEYSGGLLTGVADESGVIASCLYDLDPLDNIKGMTIDRDGIKRIYDEYGKLTSVTDQNTGLVFAITNGAVSRIEKADGTIIEEARFDAGNIISAKITRPDGVVAVYAGGVLTEIDQPDGSIITYDASGNIASYAKGGLTYTYSEIKEAGAIFTVARLSDEEIAGIQLPEEVVCQKYDSNKRLVQLIRKDGTVIDYTYNTGPAGKVTSIVANDGVTAVTYDANYNIARTEVLPTAADPVSTISEYEYGRIRRVYKGSGLVYAYSYEYDAAAAEITVIEDVKTGDVKRYKDELLISVTDKNKIVTSYEYDSDKRISCSTVTRSGKLIGRYTYTYEGDLTIIEDMYGVKRYYNKDNKIVFLEEDGKTYEYTYSLDASGNEVTTQALIRVKNEAGDIIYYEDGEIRSIVKADGTVFKDFVRVNGDADGYVVEKDGAKYFVQDGVIAKEVKSDGTIVEYYASGWVKSITKTAGEVTNYDYRMSGTDLAYVVIEKDGIKCIYDKDGRLDGLEVTEDGTSYYYNVQCELVKVITAGGEEIDYAYTDGQVRVTLERVIEQDLTIDLAGLTYNNLVVTNSADMVKVALATDKTLDYGDGSDGDFVSSGTVRLSGVKNYKSFYIRPGDTVIASDTLVIKCQGVIRIDGVISADGYGYTSGYGTGGNGSGSISAGGGGGYVAKGGNASSGGQGGVSYGDLELTTLYKGSAGGSAGAYRGLGAAGGKGGGAIKIAGKDIVINGKVSANGLDGVAGLNFKTSRTGGGGGGSGGTVYICGQNVSVSGSVTVSGGKGGTGAAAGGNGSNGRVRIDYVNFTGNMPSSNPYIKKIQLPAEGILVSSPICVTATAISDIFANMETPEGTAVLFKIRTGDSLDTADGTWSGWSAALSSEPGKYIQYQVILTRTDMSKTPSLYSNGSYAIKLSYRYDKTFDLSAPPEDILYAEHLKITAPALAPPALGIGNLRFSPADMSGLNGCINYYASSGEETIGYRISKDGQDYFMEGGRVKKSVKADGTVIEYYPNSLVKTVTAPDGKVTNYEYGIYEDKTAPDASQLASYKDTTAKLLLSMDNTSDSSLSPHAVTLKGDAKVDTSNYKVGSGAIALDGNGDYLTLADSNDWCLGAGDFTIDFWTKFDTLSAGQQVGFCSQYQNVYGRWMFKYMHGTGERCMFYYRTSSGTTQAYYVGGGIDFEAGAWYHIALVRKANSLLLFINGVYRPWGQVVIPIGTNSLSDLASPLYIGSETTTANFLKGSIDEFHLSKGTARWTNSFTPSQTGYHDPYYNTGSVTSSVIETSATEFSGISWTADLPQGTAANLKTRTGNSLDPDDGTWSDWSEALTDPAGSTITSPAAKYIQYRVEMTTLDSQYTPQVKDITIKYVTLSDGSSSGVIAYVKAEEDGVWKRYAKDSAECLAIEAMAYDITGIAQDYDYIKSCELTDDTIVETRSYKGDFLYGDGVDGEKAAAADITVNITKADQVTYFVNNKMAATYYRHDDGKLDLLVEYTYDDAGNLVLVRLPYARDSIDSQLVEARQKIAAEKEGYLRQLAAEKGLAYQQIHNSVESARAEINDERDRLKPYLYQQVTRQKWVGWWIFGWWQSYTATVEVASVRAALNQLDEEERLLNEEAAKAYARLDSQIESARDKLEQDETDSLAEITEQEAAFHSKIIEEEATPVILDYYRSILGRDPDDAEIKVWLAEVDYGSAIDVEALKTALLASGERRSEEAFVRELKAAIADKLDAYLSADEAGRSAILAPLGLTLEDTVPLDRGEVNAILAFLEDQNIHFGRSAFVSLKELLDSNNIACDLDEVALKAVLVDIFTGFINAVSDGKLLELSMFALSTTAAAYGLDLCNAKLDFEDLALLGKIGTVPGQQSSQDGDCPILPVIAHLKNNHFVVVTNIADDGKVTYKEVNKGKDGSTYTISQEDFEKSWTGYAIVQDEIGTVPGQQSLRDGDCPILSPSKLLSADQAQRIKGSCLPFLFALVGLFIESLVTIAAGVVSAITAVVAAVSSAIAPVLAAIGSAISGITSALVGITTQIFSAIQFVGVSLLNTAGAIFGGIGSAIFGSGGLGGIVSATGFNIAGVGLAIGKTVALTALSFGISKGLDLLGIDPLASGLISSFLTGGVSGLFNGGLSAMSFIAGGLQGLAVQGVSVIGQQLGLDSTLSNVIGMSAAALVGAAGQSINATTGSFDFTKFSDIIGTQVFPNIAGELTCYGVDKIGELLGVPFSDQLSYLAGMGIRSSLQVGLNPNMDPGKIWSDVTAGFLQGAVSVGLSYATQELGLSNSLLANIGFSAIAGVLNAGLQSFMPNGQKDVFKYMFDTYMKNTLTFLGYGSENNPWLQAVYTSQILDFSNIVKQKGLTEALNIYGSSFFNAVAVNEIVKTSYTLGGYFGHMIETGQYHTETVNGKEVIAVDTPTQSDGGHTTAFFDWLVDASDWDPFGLKVVNGSGDVVSWSIGEIGKDGYAKMGFYDDTSMYNEWGDLGIWQTIDNGNQTYAEIKDNEGNTIFVVTPREDGSYNYYNSYGDYVDAVITGQEQSYTFVEDFLSEFQFQDGDYTSTLDLTDFESTTFFGEGIDFDLDGSGWDIINTVSKSYDLLSSIFNEPYAYADGAITTTESIPTGQYAVRFFAKRPDGLEYGSRDLVNIGAEDFSGHTFVGLVDKNGNIIYRGLYPDSSDLLKLNNPINLLIETHEAAIRDDYYHSSNYSESTEWYTVTEQQYWQIYHDFVDEVLYETSHTYHLGANNCTDYALDIARELGIELPYADGAYSNPQRFSDALLKAEITKALGYSNFEILHETYLPDNHRVVTIKLPDGTTTDFTLLHK
ncbi:MAG: LamG-like jellyroll fold domain-containing protein [Candidatus Omnitrophota bacterium]